MGSYELFQRLILACRSELVLTPCSIVVFFVILHLFLAILDRDKIGWRMQTVHTSTVSRNNDRVDPQNSKGFEITQKMQSEIVTGGCGLLQMLFAATMTIARQIFNIPKNSDLVIIRQAVAARSLPFALAS